jgi:serine/threonine protein phosphatase PrpC
VPGLGPSRSGGVSQSMSSRLKVSVGQSSDQGRKAVNQDFHGARIPEEPLATLKGVCVALADGISSSDVSQVASQAAVAGFLEDYYCTSEAWSVRTSAERVLRATNSWLYSQTRSSQFRYEKDRGYVCTFSALVLKSRSAHIFHVGDARVYRLEGSALERLTEDHRVWSTQDESHLGRALGVEAQVDIDYQELPIEIGATFLLATDGVYEHVSERLIVDTLLEPGIELDRAAERLVRAAHENGSPDNLTVQVVRVEELPAASASDVVRELSGLPFAPELEPRMHFDGYVIVRELHASQRSHVYLALDEATNASVVLKAPAVELREDEALLERFLLEEWVARRLHSAHVLQPCVQARRRNFVYLVTEYVDGQTLRQWMLDHPKPDVESVRTIVEQIARGLRAFHRRDMLHQDLRPENIMIDRAGTVKIIDFGSVWVAGVAELAGASEQQAILGTEQYTAPEYFLGEAGSPQSDIFSLAVVTYEMLSGRLPYGARVARSRTRDAQQRLVYAPVLDPLREIPAYVDAALKKATHPNPDKRYAELSEFIHDLRHPSREFLSQARPPLIERNPAAFWKGVCAILLVIIFLLLRKLV